MTLLTRDDVRGILVDWPEREWEVQGFGQLRTYLDGPDEPRLQVWDQRLATWTNNAIHDHPWAFRSAIYAGTLFNTRYRFQVPYGDLALHEDRYACRTQIRPGTRGGLLSERPIDRGRLVAEPVEVYAMGEQYGQSHRELHLTRYMQGTVTLITRTGREAADLANVAWFGDPDDQPVFVQPYPATDDLCRTVIGDALKTWWL